MAFRQAGKVPTLAEIIINRRKINIAKGYKYLGLTLQTSTKCYTTHITDKVIQEGRTMTEITPVNLKTATTLFGCKIIPIITYGIEIILPHFTKNNLSVLQRIKIIMYQKSDRSCEDHKIQACIPPSTRNIPHSGP